jgi:mono/diheme cytochrome c family protein
MKKLLKIVGYLLLFVIVAIGGLILYATTMLPNVGDAPELKVEQTPERVKRGDYLANCVASCMDCHSKRDWSKFSGPLTPGTLGMGGETFDQKFGFPGAYYSRNITPAGIARYTDGELYRVITTGVTKEGRAMFPVMPYTHYATMDPEDIYSIIAYLRTIPSIENKVPESVSDFPMNIIINTIPSKATPGKKPDPADKVAYGAYLVNAAGCNECHTPEKMGQIIKELEFSGGRAFQMPDGSVVRTPNITPDAQTGIGNWTEDMFVGRFRAFAAPGYTPQPAVPGAPVSFMPWTMYGNMTPEDLKAIYAYLRNVKPLTNKVQPFTPAAH